MQREVLDIWQRRLRTVILVTHNIEEAIGLADRPHHVDLTAGGGTNLAAAG